ESAGAIAAGSVERRAAAKGNTHQQSTHWAQNQARVSQALEHIRQLAPSHTRGGSRMRESRTYGSGRGACDETRVPTPTQTARDSSRFAVRIDRLHPLLDRPERGTSDCAHAGT